MSNTRIDELVDQFRQGNLSRRSFVRRATALGLSATAATSLIYQAGAQDASPEATAGGETQGSYLTLEEYNAQLAEAYDFEEPQNTGGEVIYGQTTDIATINPVLTSDSYSNQVCGLIFEGLFGQSVVDTSYVAGGLAESWTISEDGLTYTFKLRENVKWHDGEPFSADDVIFTFDGVLAEGSQNQYVTTIQAALESYSKIDDYTVQLVAKDKLRTFLLDANSGVSILPKHIWQDVDPADWPTNGGSTGQDPTRVIGTGPFKFVEWIPGDHVTLERNADYWDTTSIPVIDKFIYKVNPEASSNVQSLITGEIDFIESVPPAQVEGLTSNPDLNVMPYDTLGFNWFSLNQDASKTTLFTDREVRQAMMYALDRDLMAETIYFGYAIRADGTQPVLSLAYAPDQVNTIYTYDPDKARQLLADAGWVDSDGDGIVEKDGQKLSFEIFFSEGVAQYEQQLPYMQQSWREIGIEAFPSAVPFPSLLESTDSGNFDCVVWGFSWDTTASQEAVFGTEYTPPAGFNVMHYSNPEYDELVPLEKRELDQDKAREILIQQSNIANDDAAAGIIVFRQTVTAARASLHNFFPNDLGLLATISKSWVDPR